VSASSSITAVVPRPFDRLLTGKSILTTEMAPKPDKKTGRVPTEAEIAGWQRLSPMLVAECRKDPSANVWAIFQRVIGRLPDTEHGDTWRVLHGT
jgi:hypothetical protein